MIGFRVLSSVAALALVLPMAAPRASLAQPVTIGKSAGRSGPVGGGGGGGGVHIGGGAPPTARFNGGGGGPVYIGRGGGGGGHWQGGSAGVYHRHGGGGFIPGAVAGAVIGGAIAAAPYGYYGGGPGYYDAPGYYDDQYYDNGPAQGSADTVDYCMQTYGSYDPQSGTYLGLDGLRHLCP
jgi:BA14K-like protein